MIALDQAAQACPHWDYENPSGAEHGCCYQLEAAQRAARATQPHVCACCGEETDTGEDCCGDDFPEPGDIRETGR